MENANINENQTNNQSFNRSNNYSKDVNLERKGNVDEGQESQNLMGNDKRVSEKTGQGLQNSRGASGSNSQGQQELKQQVDQQSDKTGDEGYEENRPDIDKETYEFGKEEQNRQSGTYQNDIGKNQNKSREGFGREQNQDDSRRV